MSSTSEKIETEEEMDAVKLIESKVSEGLQASSLSGGADIVNMYGRNLLLNDTTDLSFISGLSLTGLRSSAVVDDKSLIGNYNQLSDAARKHLAMVVHAGIKEHRSYHAVVDAGCFQMFAASKQGVADLALIAHRISELSLIPGIIAADAKTEGDVDAISEDIIKKYLGNPDDQVESTTPAQKMIFGETRRRVPNWYNLDYSTTIGSDKDDLAKNLEVAANHKFFYAHLPSLVKKAFADFNELTGNNYGQVMSHKVEDAQHIVLTQGSEFHKIKSVVDEIRTKNISIGCASLTMIRPFPIEEVVALLKGKQSVTILENTNGSSAETAPLYQEILASLQGKKSAVKLFSGKYGQDLTKQDIEALFDNMINDGKRKFYLGVDFVHESSKYPKHDILLSDIKREYPNLQQESLTGIKEGDKEEGDVKVEIPLNIRKYQDHGVPYSKLSRFYDDTALFYQNGEKNEMVADPFQAIPSVPSATANFMNLSSKREVMPQFDPKSCTGCGECFVHCPHSAIPAIALSIGDLINAGIRIATKNGAQIGKITPMVKNLAKISAKFIGSNGGNITIVSDFLHAGFQDLISQMKLEGEKLAGVEKDFDALLEGIAELPASITSSFFEGPNGQEQGSGEIFSLAIDPNACTGCAVCAEVCDEDALEMVAASTEIVEKNQKAFQTWEQLPDTTPETIARMNQDESYNSFASILLSRDYYMTMTGGSKNEAESPTKSLLHLVTATTESVVQPQIVAQIKEIDELIESLNQNIHKNLVAGLPTDNFDSLTKVFEESEGKKVSVDKVISSLGKEETLGKINKQDLQNKIDLVDSLKKLKWAISEGPSGTGRSHYGMAIAESNALNFTKEYPFNSFTSPTAIQWDGSAPEMATGIFQGHLRYYLDNIKLLRRAKLMAKDKYDARVHDFEIASISWDDLVEEEKNMVPPILLVGDNDSMNEKSWAGLSKLLAGKFPVKVIIVNNTALSPDSDPISQIARNNTSLLSAIAHKNAFVLQGGMGAPTHLFEGLRKGMQVQKPALFLLSSPNIDNHFITDNAWPKLLKLSIDSRTTPALSFDPSDEKGFLSSSIDLDSNSDVESAWPTVEMQYKANKEEKKIEYDVTWADWAYTLKDWKGHFSDFDNEQGEATPVAQYLSIEPAEREKKVPIIFKEGKEGLMRISVSPLVISICEAYLESWNTNKELAGMLVEFPEKLEAKVEGELQKQFDNDLAQAKTDFEAKLKEQEQVQVDIIRQKLRDKLVGLATQKN